jgi:hypothetical protein
MKAGKVGILFDCAPLEVKEDLYRSDAGLSTMGWTKSRTLSLSVNAVGDRRAFLIGGPEYGLSSASIYRRRPATGRPTVKADRYGVR